MKLMTKSSSSILELNYDAEKQELIVDFCNGSRYLYSEVPQRIIQDLQEAPSLGAFFNSQVKNFYEYRKLIEAMS